MVMVMVVMVVIVMVCGGGDGDGGDGGGGDGSGGDGGGGGGGDGDGGGGGLASHTVATSLGSLLNGLVTRQQSPTVTTCQVFTTETAALKQSPASHFA